MIRLAVSGEEAMWSVVASRLRGATIDSHFMSQELAPPTACDAVLLVEPGRPEAGRIERCLFARKHVLLTAESWLCSDVLQTLSAAARQSGVQLAVVNPEHFLPSRKLIRQQLDAGKLGSPGLVRLHRWEPAIAKNEETPAGLPAPLVRDLELALSLIGTSPNLVYAVGALANDHHDSFGRCLQVHLGFPGGGMAMIDYADRMPPGDDYVSLSVIGSAGAAYADDHQNMQLVYRGGRPQSLRVEERSLQLAGIVQEFVDGLNANRDFSASVAAWIGVLKVADSVRQSLVARRAVELEA